MVTARRAGRRVRDRSPAGLRRGRRRVPKSSASGCASRHGRDADAERAAAAGPFAASLSTVSAPADRPAESGVKDTSITHALAGRQSAGQASRHAEARADPDAEDRQCRCTAARQSARRCATDVGVLDPLVHEQQTARCQAGGRGQERLARQRDRHVARVALARLPATPTPRPASRARRPAQRRRSVRGPEPAGSRSTAVNSPLTTTRRIPSGAEPEFVSVDTAGWRPGRPPASPRTRATAGETRRPRRCGRSPGSPVVRNTSRLGVSEPGHDELAIARHGGDPARAS